MYLLGYDVGSSSIKATLLDAESGRVTVTAVSPKRELDIMASQPGWAEQHPEIWWKHIRTVTSSVLASSRIDPTDIKAIGISYQMHGLVIVDKNLNPLRPSIIWCDSRAVETGERAFRELGETLCLNNLLNSPGNFTASKLKWVMDNEPEIYAKIHKAMLPGEYIAMKMTGDIVTTPSGLSECILWDFKQNAPADIIFDHYGISQDIIGEIKPTFSPQGELTESAAIELGLRQGTTISYRAGDQPNNALSLKVLEPGEIAATAGTSGVVYGVTDKANHDPQSRVNPFVHVSHTADKPRYGVLMCINGTGILNSWIKHNSTDAGTGYEEMNAFAAEIPPGSNGLVVIPYGNGAERTLANRDIGSHITGLRFNTHDRRHLFRAGQEGIVFAFTYGLGIMHDMGVSVKTVRAGAANMFLSPIFREAFASVTEAVIELYDTDGSQGAARGAGIGSGVYATPDEAFVGLSAVATIEPDTKYIPRYREAYQQWLTVLNKIMAK